MMNEIQKTTYEFMVNEYNNGRPDEFKGANTFDLFSIHMMREIIYARALNPVRLNTREVALEFIDFVHPLIIKFSNGSRNKECPLFCICLVNISSTPHMNIYRPISSPLSEN